MEKNIPFQFISIPTARSNESSWTNNWRVWHHCHVITLSHLKCYLLHTCNMAWVMAPLFMSCACSWCHSDNMPVMSHTSSIHAIDGCLHVKNLHINETTDCLVVVYRSEEKNEVEGKGVFQWYLTCQVFVLFLCVCLMDIYWWVASCQKPTMILLNWWSWHFCFSFSIQVMKCNMFLTWWHCYVMNSTIHQIAEKSSSDMNIKNICLWKLFNLVFSPGCIYWQHPIIFFWDPGFKHKMVNS
jgi:hypothetical protein